MNKWKEILLEDACDILTCGVASTPKYVDEKEGVPFLSAQNVKDGQINLEKYNYVSKDFHEHLTKKNKPRKGDILYSRVGAKYGEAAIVDFDFEFSVYVSLTLIRPKSEIFNNEFFKYYLNSPIVKQKAKKSIKSSGVPNLNVKDVRGFNIPIPPLEEQRTIVAKLDQAFAAIDQAKANIEKNIANAKELFQSKLNQIFSQKGEGWEEKKLGEISKINYGYTEKAVFENIGPKYLRITDLTEKGVNWESVPHCKISKDEIIKYELQKGDIVFARTGATTGKSYLFDDDVFSVFASYLIRLKVINKNEILPEFIYLFFQSGNYWKEINAGISGSAQGGFNASKLSDLKLSYPLDSNIQKKIVTDFDVVLSQTNLLVTKYKQKLANLEELKKSILEKAFKGELSTAAIEKV